MNNEAYANIAVEFDDDCFNHRLAFNNINEDKESFITTEKMKWEEKMMRVFGDEPTMEPKDLALAGSSATKVGANIDFLSTHVWPKLAERSQDQLLTVCKRWGKEVITTLNFPRPQAMNWAYTKCLVLSCTQSSRKVVRMEKDQNEAEWRTMHFKYLCQL